MLTVGYDNGVFSGILHGELSRSGHRNIGIALLSPVEMQAGRGSGGVSLALFVQVVCTVTLTLCLRL